MPIDNSEVKIPGYSEDETEAAGGEDIYGADGDAGTAAHANVEETGGSADEDAAGDREAAADTTGNEQ